MSGRFRALAWLIAPPLLIGAVAPAPAEAAASTIDYVAMGDSYSAGVGTAPIDACGRSPLSYAGLWASAQAPASYRFVACGGATTDDVLKNQLSGLSTATDLVSISIGGNDVGVFPTIRACTANTDAECEQLVTAARTTMAQVLPDRLDVTYNAIRQLAPAARVVVLGYPRLFDPFADCPSDGLTTFKRQILNAAGDHLARAIAARAQAAGFVFADVRDAFVGHAACTSAAWINSSADVAAGPLHPNAAGYAQGYLPAFTAAAASQPPPPSTPPTPAPLAFGGNETWTANPYFGNQAPSGAFADVTGDGRADAIVVNNTGVTVRPSTGTVFGSPQTWTVNPYFGDRLTAFADVTGDGRADAIVVNNTGVTVRPSTGTVFGGPQTWTVNPYFGDRLTAFADVTGDGRADAIAVNNTGITVRPSTGSTFSVGEPWTTSVYGGDRLTAFADVTNDGRADAIAVNNTGITVRRSTGTAFGAVEAWTRDGYFGNRAPFNAFADVTGDARADAIVVNNSGVTVRRVS